MWKVLKTVVISIVVETIENYSAVVAHADVISIVVKFMVDDSLVAAYA